MTTVHCMVVLDKCGLITDMAFKMVVFYTNTLADAPCTT